MDDERTKIQHNEETRAEATAYLRKLGAIGETTFVNPVTATKYVTKRGKKRMTLTFIREETAEDA